MKVERITSSGQTLRQAFDALEVAFAAGRALHALQHIGVGVLEGHVQVGQHQALCHHRQDLVDVRVGVDVVQAHPGAMRLGDLARLLDQVEELGPDRAPSQKPVRYLMSTP